MVVMAQAPQDRPPRKREAASRNLLPLLQTQCTVSRVLASAEDLQTALPSIIASICINLGWELGAFWQYAATRPVLMCTNISAADEALGRFIAESRKNELLAGEGLPGRVFANSQPEWIVDINKEKDFLSGASPSQVGLQSAFAFPVLVANDAVAVLEFLSSKFREPDDELLETMVSLGRQIGQFMKRKEAEEALQQSLELYRNLTDSASDAIITIDESSNILLANRAAEFIFGYPAAELKGQSVTMLIPEHSRMQYEHTVAKYLETDKKGSDCQVVEVVGRHRGGREILLELSFGEFLLKGQRYFTGFMREKKQMAVGN
ncbi:MAG TPA: PAS domain S-box protein [Candidatus Angelobacter sp.]|nr:PAS domain S-box protein [Candidatus Angelobacter sp.]